MANMTEQEFREIVSQNPVNYFSTLHEQGVEQFKAMGKAGENQVTAVMQRYMDAAVELLTRFSKELSIFRALEVEMRNDSITPESLADYLGKLAAFREQVQSDNKARSLAKG